MSWLTGSDGPWTMVLGGLMLLSAWLLWRSHTWGAASRRRDPLDEARAAISEREHSETARIRNLEVRLFEFQREVEATIATRMAMLEKLTADADREIQRLVTAIAEARGFDVPETNDLDDAPVFRLGTVDDWPAREVVDAMRLLRDAGFDIREIARLVEQPEAIVEDVVGPIDRADAA